MDKQLKDIPKSRFGAWLIQRDQLRKVIKDIWLDKCDWCGKKTQITYWWIDPDNKDHIEQFCSYECLCGFDEVIPVKINEVYLIWKKTQMITVEL